MLFTLSCGINSNKNDEIDEQDESNSVFKYGICVDSLDINHYTVERGDLLSSILNGLGFAANFVEQIAETITPYYHPSKMQIGNTYATITSQDTLNDIKYLVFEKNRTDFGVIDLCKEELTAYESSKPISLKRE